MCICGIDEAGRGSWAGDMYIAGAILESDTYIQGLKDSKKLTVIQRERLLSIIEINSCYHIVTKNASDIDNKGLSLCLQEAIEEIVHSLIADRYIMDGNTNFGVIGVDNLIKGDDKIPAISAASIIAKVNRDRYMCALPDKYAKYQFCQHKGYGTQLHQKLIAKYGLADIHRHSFNITNK